MAKSRSIPASKAKRGVAQQGNLFFKEEEAAAAAAASATTDSNTGADTGAYRNNRQSHRRN